MRATLIVVFFGFVMTACLSRASGNKVESNQQPAQSFDAEASVSDEYLVAWDEEFMRMANDMSTTYVTVEGISLADIITSGEPAREDMLLCSHCHNSEETQGGYAVDVEKDGFSPDVTPFTKLVGRTWYEKGGWGDRFVDNKTKPIFLRKLVSGYLESMRSMENTMDSSAL